MRNIQAIIIGHSFVSSLSPSLTKEENKTAKKRGHVLLAMVVWVMMRVLCLPQLDYNSIEREHIIPSEVFLFYYNINII